MKFKISLLTFVLIQSLFFSNIVYAGNTEIPDIVYENAQESIDGFVENTRDDVIDLYAVRFESIKENILVTNKVDFEKIKRNLTNFIFDKYKEVINRLLPKNE